MIQNLFFNFLGASKSPIRSKKIDVGNISINNSSLYSKYSVHSFYNLIHNIILN